MPPPDTPCSSSISASFGSVISMHVCRARAPASAARPPLSMHAIHKMDNREMFYFSHGPVINGPANLPLSLKRFQRHYRSHLDLVWILHPCPGP